MSKLVVPLPMPEWQPEKVPTMACWWRHAMINKGPQDYLYTITRGSCEHEDCKFDCPDATWVMWEWFDNLDIIIDAGFDAVTVWAVCQVYIEPIDYIDLLSKNRPAESFYRITKHGDWIHPGMCVVKDLDWEGNNDHT